MTELFANGDTSATFRAHAERVTKEIEKFSDEKILGADIDEWTNYYFAEYKIQPINLFLDSKTQTLSESKIEQHNHWHDFDPSYEPKTFKIDGFKVTFRIPFDGDSGLLYLRSSSHYMMRFPVDNIKGGDDSTYGEIQFSLEFLKQGLQEKGTPDSVESAFTDKFKYYIETVDRINRDVEQFNESLPDIIRSALEMRKRKADEYVAMSERLSIPIKINPNAPYTTPVPLRKTPAKKPEMPSIKPREKNFAIYAEDYDNIRRIIYTTGSSMEKTAKTYAKLDEEELRDVLLSHLNSHYDGTATGETFSKVGKTDIHIPFENKAAFIAECKIWYGEKQLGQSLEQLFSYTTWRDVRTSLIIFNKVTKDFAKILKTIQSYLDSYGLCKRNKSANANEWHCEFIKSLESSETIDVQVVTFDLFVNSKEATAKK